MSDSHKISLLDLQRADLSQYGKKNLDHLQGASNNADSSYRKQLSETLAKKKPSPSTDSKRDFESRTVEVHSDKKRTENTKNDTPTKPASQDHDVHTERDETRIGRDGKESVDSENQDSTTAIEKSISTQESDTNNSSEVNELSEENILPLPEFKQSVKQKEPIYSLFDSTFTGQNEGSFQQEATTEDGEITPPANFQFVEGQPLVDLEVQVTETNPGEAIPIPGGLAELLNQQGVDPIESNSGKETQTAPINIENQKLDSILTGSSDLSDLQGVETNIIDAEGLSNSEELPEIELSVELEQAIQELEQSNSGESVGANEVDAIDVQSIVQQQSIHSTNENQSKSPSTESDHGVVTGGQESTQGISETAFEQVSQDLSAAQTDTTKNRTQATDQEAEATTQNTGIENPNLTLNVQTQAQAETAKTAPVVQEVVSSSDLDQPVTQQSATGQSNTISGTQSNTPVSPTVDVKQIEQLVERIVGAIRQSQSTEQQLKIRLSPPELGTLQIEVSLKNGQYTAKLDVQNSQVQKVINDNMVQLRDALAKSGIAIDRIEVNINTDSSEDQHSSQSGTGTKSGNDFQSENFSEHAGDSDQRQEENSSMEESSKRDSESEEEEQDSPQVIRSQGVTTENVEEIDIQI